MLDPPRQENCILATGKARQLDMGKTIWPPKHLRTYGFECQHPAGHSMLAFQSLYPHLLRCRSTGPLGYGIFVDTSQISNKLDTSIKFITWDISIYPLFKIPDAGEFDYIYFKICGYSDEANDVLAAARGGGGGGGSWLVWRHPRRRERDENNFRATSIH